jgi:hypothetical protein
VLTKSWDTSAALLPLSYEGPALRLWQLLGEPPAWIEHATSAWRVSPAHMRQTMKNFIYKDAVRSKSPRAVRPLVVLYTIQFRT